MEKPLINIVWLKRDLRTQDHKPLQQAQKSRRPYLIIYCHEPSLVKHPDTSLRHLLFIHHSIKCMNETLKKYNRAVYEFQAEVIEVLEFLKESYSLSTIFSHKESGIKITWERDKQVRAFCDLNNIQWIESDKDGIERGIKNRDGWDKRWYAKMHKGIIDNTYSIQSIRLEENPLKLSSSFRNQLNAYPMKFQPAGEASAWKYLHSFVKERGRDYHKLMSKPLASRTSCSRLSTYIAWGNLSIKQAYQFIKDHPAFKHHKRASKGVLTRLKWHCHFIQKFEVACSYETHCINKGYESVPHIKKEDFIEAWKKGRTGFPLVDACMRCVAATGWLNFRMRAMLVSFLCYHLDQDWRDGAYHLAQKFLDYEPGIHYPQFQMQAGTTGVNIVRIYNPVKQSLDHDPEGVFIRKWVPELRALSNNQLHRPWLLTEMEQQLFGFRLGADYPRPIVDPDSGANEAREKIWAKRKDPLVIKENYRILRTHTRRKTAVEK